MKITLSKKSKIGNVDFENLEFGKIFTDHIFVSKYSNGQLSEGEIMPYGDFLISPSARVFHNGQAPSSLVSSQIMSFPKSWRLGRPSKKQTRRD